MSSPTDNPPRPRRGRWRLGSDERQARHLQLVTDEWLAELTNQRTVLPFARRGPLAPRAAEGRGGPAPLRPA